MIKAATFSQWKEYTAN